MSSSERNSAHLWVITAHKRSLGHGNIFAPVCSQWEGVPGQVHAPGQVHPPGQIHPLSAVHAGRYGQHAGGTHPTGMQSCYRLQTKFGAR